MLALIAVGLISSLAAERQGLALHEWRAVFLLGGLFYWLVTRVPLPARPARGPAGAYRHPGQVACGQGLPWPMLDGLLLGMVFVSGLALWQLVTGQGRIDVEGVGRVRAFYGSPNNLALVLDRCLPLALGVALFGRGWVRRRAYAVAVAIMAAACVATFSKGSLLLGLPVGAGLVLLLGAWRTQRRWPLYILGGGAASSLSGCWWRCFAPLALPTC